MAPTHMIDPWDKYDLCGHLKLQVKRHLPESRLAKQIQLVYVWGWRNLYYVVTCTSWMHLSSTNGCAKNALRWLMPNQCRFFEVAGRVPRLTNSSIEAHSLFETITTMLPRDPWYSTIKNRQSQGLRLQVDKKRGLLYSTFVK